VAGRAPVPQKKKKKKKNAKKPNVLDGFLFFSQFPNNNLDFPFPWIGQWA